MEFPVVFGDSTFVLPRYGRVSVNSRGMFLLSSGGVIHLIINNMRKVLAVILCALAVCGCATSRYSSVTRVVPIEGYKYFYALGTNESVSIDTRIGMADELGNASASTDINAFNPSDVIVGDPSTQLPSHLIHPSTQLPHLPIHPATSSTPSTPSTRTALIRRESHCRFSKC